MKHTRILLLSIILGSILIGCGVREYVEDKQEERLSGEWKILDFSFVDNSGNARKYVTEEMLKEDKVDILLAPSMNFDTKENRVYGSASCNNYFSTFSYKKPVVTFSVSGATRKLCDTQMGFEFNFLRNLEGDFNVSINKNHMTLKRGNVEINLSR